MDDLRITTVQTHLHWEDVAANLAMFDKLLAGLAGKTDLVILPEMFTTGFSMNAAALAEQMGGRTFRWLEAKARDLNAVVTGSFIAVVDDKYYNRLVWMQPDGQFTYYDKRHLFTLAGEHETYQPGMKKLIAEWKGWRICPLICYDLRFPAWSRNAEGFDLLIYVANWPVARSHHWRQLLMGRAIENQVYVAGVNRIGEDAKGLHYSGDTTLIDYTGQIAYQVSGKESVWTCTINKKEMADFREKLNFLKDQDVFKILS